MKVTLDLEQLLKDEKITTAEYEKFSQFSAKTTASLAFNLLIGFGVIAVSGAALALTPSITTALVIGLLTLMTGLFILRSTWEQWRVLANICLLIGALMTGGSILAEFKGSLMSILSVSAIYAIIALFARSALLSVLATLMLSASIGAKTGYFHASYFLVIQEPSLTILLFTLLAIGLYQLSKKLSPEYANVALISARTSIFLINFGFWIGSLWGDKTLIDKVIINEIYFVLLWALALLATAIWAWKNNHRWVLNTCATFAGIHFYTQWFERLGATPESVLLAGLLALTAALTLKRVNNSMKKKAII